MMEPQPTFHPGVMTEYTRNEVRLRRRERERKKKADKKKKHPTPRTILKRPQWRILPCDMQYSLTIDTLKGNTYIQKMEALQEYGRCLNVKCDFFPKYEPNPQLKQQITDMRNKCIEIAKENQRIRWIFKRFLTKWRIAHLKEINDTDFMSLLPIEKEVHSYNFSHRTKYRFEASSILQDIHKKLLTASAQIPTPIRPRNPYTNETFTLPQLLGIHSQCKALGCSAWTLEAFAKCKLNLELFSQVHRKPLRIHAIKAMLYEYSDWDGMDLLLNFIESHHEEHAAIFNKHIYLWCLKEIPDEPKIQLWRSLCRDYYIDDILADDDAERDLCFHRAAQKTGSLCAPPHDLLAKRNLLLRARKSSPITR